MGSKTLGQATVILVLGLLLAAVPAAADTEAADRAFSVGNDAFRSGNYTRALAKYEEARAAGKDSPRLVYNLGLTHLRLGQYAEARSAFLESARDDRMAGLSSYQLGVLAYGEGRQDEAESWFRKSRRYATSSRLRDMSTEALETIGAPPTEFSAVVSVGFGSDSNAYRAPSDTYDDLSVDPPATVDPVEQSGGYVPVRLVASFTNPLSSQTQFIAGYRHRGDYYTDSTLSNADETDHRLRVGMLRFLGDRQSQSRQFEAALELRSHAETNFDRDDGLDRFDDGASIADRFDFNAVGAEFMLKNRLGETRYEVEAGYSMRDYEDVPTASSYDLNSIWARGALKLPLGDRSRVKVAYGFHLRSFDERRSRDLTGDASTDNPTLEYRYQVVALGIRHRFTERLVTEFTYSYTRRDDQFVGYNDYTRDRFEWETSYDFSDKISASLEFDYRDQQYPNAFAFDDPTQPEKEYQDLELTVGGVYRFSRSLSLRAEIRQDNVDSSDPRGEYDRLRTRVGVYWRF